MFFYSKLFKGQIVLKIASIKQRVEDQRTILVIYKK